MGLNYYSSNKNVILLFIVIKKAKMVFMLIKKLYTNFFGKITFHFMLSYKYVMTKMISFGIPF